MRKPALPHFVSNALLSTSPGVRYSLRRQFPGTGSKMQANSPLRVPQVLLDVFPNQLSVLINVERRVVEDGRLRVSRILDLVRHVAREPVDPRLLLRRRRAPVGQRAFRREVRERVLFREGVISLLGQGTVNDRADDADPVLLREALQEGFEVFRGEGQVLLSAKQKVYEAHLAALVHEALQKVLGKHDDIGPLLSCLFHCPRGVDEIVLQRREGRDVLVLLALDQVDLDGYRVCLRERDTDLVRHDF